jgi:hypothetical protein
VVCARLPTLASHIPPRAPQLSGTGFGSPAQVGATVTVAGAVCTITFRNDSLITCALPAGAGSSQPVVVTVGGLSSPSFPFSYDKPVVSGVVPLKGATVGQLITIVGDNFGTAPSVSISSVACNVTASNHTAIVCSAQAGSGSGKLLSVTTGSPPQSSSAVSWGYRAPTLTNITPATGPTAGNFLVTLIGSDFSTPPSASISFRGASISPFFQNETRVVFLLPRGEVSERTRAGGAALRRPHSRARHRRAPWTWALWSAARSQRPACSSPTTGPTSRPCRRSF